MEKLLLHSCCGPCSSGVLEDLCKKYDVTILFYNPNIYPLEEYKKRLQAQEQIVNELNKLGSNIHLIECDYDNNVYERYIVGLENEQEGGKRCEKCFRLRMEETCKFAKANNYDIFTTTMSVSPHKDYILLNKIGNELSYKYSIKYLEANFKKNNGFLKSINNSKKYNLYRQNYCGCRYSIWQK